MTDGRDCQSVSEEGGSLIRRILRENTQYTHTSFSLFLSSSYEIWGNSAFLRFIYIYSTKSELALLKMVKFDMLS